MDSRAWLTGYKSLPEGAVPAYAQQYGDGEHVLTCYRVIEKALVDVDMAGSIGNNLTQKTFSKVLLFYLKSSN